MTQPRSRRTLVVTVMAVLATLFGANVSNGSDSAGAAPAAFCLPPLIPCPQPPAPEPDTFATGAPFTGTTPDGKVRGLLQSHDHPFSSLGFGQGPFCGKTFDAGGIAKAMVDCPEHNPLGIPAWFEQLSSGQLPLTPHDTVGWPTFKDWPAPDSMMHNQTYYKGIERLWRAGMRVYVMDVTTNRGLCILYSPKRAPCDEMDSMRREIQGAYGLQSYVDGQHGGVGNGWFRIVTDPAQARQVVEEGKLAVILGIEISEPFRCSQYLGVAQCTEADIDAGLDEVYGLGVRSMYLCHKYDNALCGVRFDSEATGVVVNVGNFVTTGKFWQAETCTGPRHDNTIIVDANVLGTLLAAAAGVLGPITLPLYPPAPHCNVHGLTSLGEHMLDGMMQRGMIVEVDHMSVKAADQTLTILEQAGYSGVISSHDWMDKGYNSRVQNLGGLITPISKTAASFVDTWRLAKSTASAGFEFGFGYGLDLNGLHSGIQLAGQGPQVTYPFVSYDGGTALAKQVWGQRTWDLNADGMAHEGMVPDWLESTRLAAGSDGPAFVADMLNGAEAYLQMWERASS